MRFNEKSTNKNYTLNYEGEPAYSMSDEMELYSAVVTSSMSDNFYERDDERMNRIMELVGKVDPRFVAQLAIYTRSEMNLRSVPVFLLVALARVHSGDDLVSRTVERVIQRADEITELLACYQKLNPTGDKVKKLAKVSNQLLKGLRAAFNKFDEYQFAKYDRAGVEVKLRDALFLVHPKAKDAEQQAIFDKIVTGSLSTPYTWETELSELGKTRFADDEEKNAAFARKWEELVESRRMGYMATLRNLRNMLTLQVSDETMQAVCNYLSNPGAVHKSRQLPFRFLSAYREVNGLSGVAREVLDALEKAVVASAENIRGFDADTRVLMACDVSGSMMTPVSPRSSVMDYDIGLMLAMLMRSRCKSVIAGLFGTDWKPVMLPEAEILKSVGELRKHEGVVGYSTNGYKVINWLVKNEVVMDKVIFFTDCQMWNSSNGSNDSMRRSWEAYKQIAPNAKLYLFDLCGYGTTPLDIARPDVFLIAGWNEKVFDVLHAVENGDEALSKIHAIEI